MAELEWQSTEEIGIFYLNWLRGKGEGEGGRWGVEGIQGGEGRGGRPRIQEA